MVDPEFVSAWTWGSKTHWVGIAGPDGEILEEFVIPHHQEGFREFFDRVERHRRKLDLLPLAKDVLQEVPEAPPENEKLKRLSRRRRQLVNEEVRVVNRLQADLQSVCPELLAITNDAGNLWFLRFSPWKWF